MEPDVQNLGFPDGICGAIRRGMRHAGEFPNDDRRWAGRHGGSSE